MQIKNLEKIKTLTQRIIPAIKVGHSEAIAQELLQIPLPQQYETSVLESLDEPHKFNMDQDKVRLGQGQLQDREFLNALALVVGSKFFENFTFYEEQEKVVFRFYKKQQLYSVIVDFQIPLVGHLPQYAQTYNNNIYCSLIEKAYAALQGTYQDLNGVSLRDCIRDLTGLDPDIVIYPSPESINLKMLQLSDSVIGFIFYTHIEFTFKKQSFVPVPNRMYFVKSIDQNKYLIKDYFDDQEYEIIDPQTAFNCVVIIKDFPDEYRGMSVEVNTNNGGVPAPGNQQWINNPSFQFQVGVGVQQQETPFVFRLSELEQQDGITGILLLNQRDVRTFSQNNVVYMTKPNIIQLGGRKQNYTVTFQTLSKGYYTLFVFSTSKAASRVLLEIFYSGRPSTLEFKFKSNSILEYCTQDDDQLRLLKDKSKQVPGSFRQLMILNQAALVQKPYIDNPKLDSEQEFLVENQLQEELLGMGLDGQEPVETDVYDFSYYLLDDESFQLLLPELIAEDRIRDLRLKGNKLTDDSILKLCYELEKSYHTELELLDVSENSITKQGIETLQQFKKRFKIEIIK